MDEEIILSIAKERVHNNRLTYDDFEELFYYLTLKEQYKVTDILYEKYHISLVDSLEENLEIFKTETCKGEIFDDENRCKANQNFIDEFFKDDNFEENVFLDKDGVIHQSNEILCTLIQRGNDVAMQDLCIKNQNLVRQYAKKFHSFFHHKLEESDLTQAGFLGLMRAAKKFDAQKGYAFTTYAVPWIKQAITREIFDSGYTIRIPVHMMEKILKVTRLEKNYAEKGKDLDSCIILIASDTGLSEKEIREAVRVRNQFNILTSLNKEIGENSDTELLEVIEDDQKSVYDIVSSNALKCLLIDELDSLNNRERSIIIKRYGLSDGRERTLEEIGKDMNLTRERIRQIQGRAMKKLSRELIKKEFINFLYE